MEGGVKQGGRSQAWRVESSRETKQMLHIAGTQVNWKVQGSLIGKFVMTERPADVLGGCKEMLIILALVRVQGLCVRGISRLVDKCCLMRLVSPQ